MRPVLPFLAVLVTAMPGSAQRPDGHTLMPVPASVSLSTAQLRIDTGFSVSIVRHRDPRLDRAIGRTVSRLELRLGVPIPRRIANGAAGSLSIDVAGAGFGAPDLAEDESYQLTVSATQAQLSAATVVGAIRGLETFLQLQSSDARGVFIQGADIRDAPRFRWRGLLLDVSRHFEGVDVIKRLLDGMAMVKLNVFHWHLSDDQGFRVESRVYPKLHQLGSDSMFYSQAQIRDIVAYAADRGIRVMPEFDVPGHSSAWFVGYPSLTVGAGPFTIARTWGTFEPTMDPTRESTYRFLDAFIGEIAALFPDKYWHIGGDEVDPKQWKGNRAIQAYMKRHHLASEVALHTAFNARLFKIVQKHGKTPVGWNEIFQPGLPTSAVIQSWNSTAVLATSVKAGFRGILSAPYYIDHMKAAADFYRPDPIPANTDLTPEQQAFVLGGEACMWGEYVVSETLPSRIWPRLAAIAERFWSPQYVVDVPDMYRRLDVTSRRLGEFGLRHEEHIARNVQRLAGDSTALFTALLAYVRPKDFGGSGNNQFFPHTRLIDAAIPDPRPSWDITGRARRAAGGDATATAQLRADFARMGDLQARLQSVHDFIPAANDGIEVAGAMSNLSRIGLDALDLIGRQSTAEAMWTTNADSVLAALAPRRINQWLLVPTVTDAVRILVDAAKGLPPPRN